MPALSRAYGRLLGALAGLAALLLLAMVVGITADIVGRNALGRGVRGVDELSEYALYLITAFTAPWLLRRGQHIRVDILLRAIPRRAAWYCEWATDAIGLACCLVMVLYGAKMTFASYSSASLSVKTLVTPEWWLLAPLPAAFALLAIEVLFRMRRLLQAERGPRGDAVSAA